MHSSRIIIFIDLINVPYFLFEGLISLIKCTILFGKPVVPDEYMIYKGWSKGSRSKIKLSSVG